MDKYDFLSLVLSKQGYYCLFTRLSTEDGDNVRVQFYDSLDEFVSACDAHAKTGHDVYFGCAKFFENTRRIAANAKYFKSFWIDIDCGDKKSYATHEDAASDLKRFCNTLGLPAPTVVNSGNGLHCYWVLEEDIGYNEWKPIATHLQVMANTHNLKVDSVVTADAARILRVPGTKNYKNKENPKPVEIIKISTPMPLDKFKTLIGYRDGVVSGAHVRSFDALTKSLMGGMSSKFSTIIQKSDKGAGCAQLDYIIKYQEEISEPLWRSALSIAQYCVDRDVAIHQLSNQCSSYDPSETEEKANNCAGPHTCAIFERERPEGCAGCALKGTINSPISIGKFIAEATPEDNIITVMHAGLLQEVDAIIPEYPFPFFRGKNGGVYKRSWLEKKEGDEVEGETTYDDNPTLIYDNDLYIEKRLIDPDVGEAVLIKLILPQDGLKEFTAPLTDILSKDKARNLLAYHGVAALDKQMLGIMSYLATWVEHLQNTSKAEVARSQFGWHDDGASFLIGTRHITKDGLQFSPPSATTEEIAKYYTSKGTLAKWTELANLYGKPGNEARAFSLGVSFGAPLLKFTSIRGFIVHLSNEKSGVGKSTVQYMANSVWGHPVDTMLTFDDKPLARQHRFGVLNNIICCIDEITDLAPEEAGHTAFMVTQGKGRDRMQSQVNAIRRNNTRWALPVITSGNNSLHELLQSNKVLPEGELMRIIELTVPPDDSLTKEEADEYFDVQLPQNYGLAGEVLMTFMVNNREECEAIFTKNRRELDSRIQFTSKERFYSTACALSITGLEIAKRCGLHSIDIEKIKSWVYKQMIGARDDLDDIRRTPLETFAEFITDNLNNTLTVNGEKVNGIQPVGVAPRSGNLYVRYEPDTKIVFVLPNVLKAWCTNKSRSYKDLIIGLRDSGMEFHNGTKRFSSGCPGIPSLSVYALGFDVSDAPDLVTDIPIL